MGRRKPEITDRHRAVAKDYFRGGKSLERAMASNGFAPAYGRQGIRNVARTSRPFREAFKEEMDKAVEEAESVDLAPSKLEKLMLHRLAMNLVRGKDEGSQTAKIVGGLKAIDAFVRNGDIQLGIFSGLTDPANMKILDEIVDSLPKDDSQPAHGESQDK